MKLSVLHVEDSDDDADQIELALDAATSDWRAQAELNRVEDVSGAKASIASSRPHVVLLDLNLPGLSGHDLLADLKSDPSTREIPVVVLTTSEAYSDVQMAYRNFASAYLVKPNSFTALMTMMGRLHDFWLREAKLPA